MESHQASASGNIQRLKWASLVTTTQRNLAGFSGAGYDKGRPKLIQALWVIVSTLVCDRIWCPPQLRVALLRLFGASIGNNVLIRHGVRIHWPWKLSIADNVWIGVDAWLLNLEKITIGSDVCISQGAFLCTGSHDQNSPTFEFDNAGIVIADGVWIAARATVLRGVTVGANAVVGATALVHKDVPDNARVFAPPSTVAVRRSAP
ncbi:putative colanic acid biosynthesis acetyltransferase [Paenarthrobacter nicotinovorans]|uniref:putative colanic acid biosynthesis acetyltransferase n=1 Tax=Paenarthrobacter nicotinovorans TaxID=29320 RepID=UPI00381AF503